MNPIKCPKCETEVIPHETHLQRWEDIFDRVIADKRYQDFLVEEKLKIAIALFTEINDFIISDNISKDKFKITKEISKQRS